MIQIQPNTSGGHNQQLVAVNAASQTGLNQQHIAAGNLASSSAPGPGQTITVIPVTGAIPVKPVSQVFIYNI